MSQLEYTLGKTYGKDGAEASLIKLGPLKEKNNAPNFEVLSIREESNVKKKEKGITVKKTKVERPASANPRKSDQRTISAPSEPRSRVRPQSALTRFKPTRAHKKISAVDRIRMKEQACLSGLTSRIRQNPQDRRISFPEDSSARRPWDNSIIVECRYRLTQGVKTVSRTENIEWVADRPEFWRMPISDTKRRSLSPKTRRLRRARHSSACKTLFNDENTNKKTTSKRISRRKTKQKKSKKKKKKLEKRKEK